MKAIGIICEYNPFHNGHIYHLQKVKELFPDHAIVLVMSGHFMQRGEISIINKWDKTKIALDFGVDIVIELPFVFATQGADIFGKGAIQILDEMKVTHIIFGTENMQIETLDKIAHIQTSKSYNQKVQKYLNDGINYPTAMNKALESFQQKGIKNPNDLLALSYIKAILEIKSSIVPVRIQRTNDYHKLTKNSSITSASSIRSLLKEKKEITNYVPNETIKYIDTYFSNENYYPFLKYKVLTEINHLEKYQTVDEGLNTRIQKYIHSSLSLEELIQNVKTKRYTYNKLTRMFTHILCNFTKEEAKMCTTPEYIRILGFSKTGRKYLNQIKKNTNIPIITKYGDTKSLELEIEKRATTVYASIFKEEEKRKMIEAEYKNQVIQK